MKSEHTAQPRYRSSIEMARGPSTPFFVNRKKQRENARVQKAIEHLLHTATNEEPQGALKLMSQFTTLHMRETYIAAVETVRSQQPQPEERRAIRGRQIGRKGAALTNSRPTDQTGAHDDAIGF